MVENSEISSPGSSKNNNAFKSNHYTLFQKGLAAWVRQAKPI
jgi:hypothetical protein